MNSRVQFCFHLLSLQKKLYLAVYLGSMIEEAIISCISWINVRRSYIQLYILGPCQKKLYLAVYLGSMLEEAIYSCISWIHVRRSYIQLYILDPCQKKLYIALNLGALFINTINYIIFDRIEYIKRDLASKHSHKFYYLKSK